MKCWVGRHTSCKVPVDIEGITITRIQGIICHKVFSILLLDRRPMCSTPEINLLLASLSSSPPPPPPPTFCTLSKKQSMMIMIFPRLSPSHLVNLRPQLCSTKQNCWCCSHNIEVGSGNMHQMHPFSGVNHTQIMNSLTNFHTPPHYCSLPCV